MYDDDDKTWVVRTPIMFVVWLFVCMVPTVIPMFLIYLFFTLLGH